MKPVGINLNGQHLPLTKKTMLYQGADLQKDVVNCVIASLKG